MLRNRVLLTALALFGAYWIAARFVHVHYLIEALRILQVSVAVAVVISYMGPALDAVRSERVNLVQQLSLGISLGFLSLALTGGWFTLWRLAGQPQWMPNSDINGFFIWLSILAGALHLTAPGAIDGRIPPRNWVWLGAAVGGAVLLFLIFLAQQPDLAWFAKALEPWLAEEWRVARPDIVVPPLLQGQP